MSQHYYPAVYQGEPVTVLIGFDRPLQGFFMVIERDRGATAHAEPTDDDDDEGDLYVYSNLSDSELFGCGGLPNQIDHFVRRLRTLDIPAHASVIAGVLADKAGNVGNRHVRYDEAGIRLAG